MGIALANFDRPANPVDLVENIASNHDWPFERSGEDELTLSIEGGWCEYHLSLNWRDDLQALHLACAFDFKPRPARLGEIYRLMAMINEQLWVGHFDLWKDDGLLLYRHGLPLNGADASTRQCEALLQAALEACERYYQAFQFVLWAGRDADAALQATLFETQGQA